MKMFVALDDRVWAEDSAMVPAAETVIFAIDGTEYEIDLAEANAAKLRGALSEWLPYARKVSRQRKEQPALEAAPAEGIPRYGRVLLHHAVGKQMRQYWKGCREWCEERGYPTKTDGGNYYISADHVEEYERYLDDADRLRIARAG
jgi:Lsr2